MQQLLMTMKRGMHSKLLSENAPSGKFLSGNDVMSAATHQANNWRLPKLEHIHTSHAR